MNRVLTAARRGDEAAFRALVEPHRAELHAHCYRMLGSLHDAEDALQETLLRAWRGLPRFEGRSSLRSWLYRIATNTCLNAIEKRPRIEHVDPYPEPLPDGKAAPDARYELRESVELAFVAALQHLPANQRAALILREVLGFSARETAEWLDTTTASVNSALQRARKLVDERLPEQSQQVTLRSLGDERLRGIVEGYTSALERGDVDAILAMLTEDATWSMPPEPDWYRGQAAIAAFLAAGPLTVRWRHLAARASGQPAVGCYAWDEASGRYVANVIDVLTLRGGRIAAVTAFIGREWFPRFGLPDELR